MTWKGAHPEIAQLPGEYPSGAKLSRKKMEPWEARLGRSATLPKYDITIRPKSQPAAAIRFLPLAQLLTRIIHNRSQELSRSCLAAETEASRRVKERLDEIRAELREQRKLLDSLMREGRGGMRK